MTYNEMIEDGLKRSVGSGCRWHLLEDFLRECKFWGARTKHVGYFGVPFNILIPYIEEKIKNG